MITMEYSVSALKLLIAFCLVVPSQTEDSANFCVMSVAKGNDSTANPTFCVTYNPDFHDVPNDKDSAVALNLVDLTGKSNELLCTLSDDFNSSYVGSVIAVKRGNCTFSEKAANAQSLGGAAILIVSDELLHEPMANSSADYNTTHIIVAMILVSDFESAKAVGANLSVKFYAPYTKNYDLNLLFIWLTAVFTVIVGSYLSGHMRYQVWLQTIGVRTDTQARWQISDDEVKNNVEYSPKIVVFIVIIMCAMLLGLYFLYDYLVYVIIVLFALGSSYALYECLWLFMITVLPPFATRRIPPNRIYCCRSRPEIRSLVLMALCFAIGIWWIVERNKSYAWILQDILGVAFCIQMLKKIRLPSFKVCFILLVLLFVYDIFFVFITPLLTRDGSSVMVDIATGRNSKSNERLPMVILFPKMNTGNPCLSHMSLLGFGDIFVPGLLVSFCYGFDLLTSSGAIYFITSITAYGFGLALTFVALVLMQTGQPALLYLVPCTLLAVILTALWRKELKEVWSGKPKTSVEVRPGTETVNLSRSDSRLKQSDGAALASDEAADYSSADEGDNMLGKRNK